MRPPHTQVPLTVALLAAAAAAQEPGSERTVSLTVVQVADRSVYFDHGRDVGLRVGSFVRLFLPGAGEIEIEVRTVSQTSARAELPPDVPSPPVGTRGEARTVVPTETAKPAANQAPTVQHPPWTRREEPRGAAQPLLVPTFSRSPAERPATLDGRLFSFAQWNSDSSGDTATDYLLWRTGLRADATNWLGVGERTRFAGEYDDRRILVDGGPDQIDQTGRIDLASVAIGTEAWAATGLEAGRFFSQFLPEIGLVDGVEFVRRMTSGVRYGGGVGAYPRPFPARQQGDDVGLHAFVDYTADAQRTFAAALGVQKTWHLGVPDRDLLLLRGEWRPGGGFWLLGSSKVDYYTGADTIKGRGFDLTELLVQARWDGGKVGTGLSASRFTWPELRRAEYQVLPVELVRDGFVDRVSWNASLRPASTVTLRPRVDLWHDQQRSGRTLGLDGDWRSVWSETSALSASLFANHGGYTAGPGARLQLRDRIGACTWRLGYRWYRYELADLITGAESYSRQSTEIGLSAPLGATGDLDLAFERWFGDREDAYAVSLYLQWRF